MTGEGHGCPRFLRVSRVMGVSVSCAFLLPPRFFFPYDRASGDRLWRTDKRPQSSGSAAGMRMAIAPDGSLVVTGQALLGFLDWYTVALDSSGGVRWERVRDGGLNTDEIPAAVLVLPDGTSVVTGRVGPALPGGFWGGVTAGYSTDGTLLWEAFSPFPSSPPRSAHCPTATSSPPAATRPTWQPSGRQHLRESFTAVDSSFRWL